MRPKASIHLRMISHQSKVISLHVVEPPHCPKLVPTIIVVFVVRPENGRRRDHQTSPGKLRWM
jgi:hypothetical protein